MEYDLLGRRIRKTGRDRETSFLWSGMRLARESSGTHSASYVYEQGSYVPLARVDTDGGKEIRMYYFHCAVNGMPEEITDREGKLVWRARYSVPGKMLFEQTSKHVPAGFEQNLRMQGQYDDRETGLYYNTFRYYDADTGRFTTHDPIGLRGGMNLYQYAPNPMSWIDPWGWESGDATHAPDFDTARRQGFENAGMMNPDDVTFSKYDPKTGTVVEFKGPGGAKVAYDGPHADGNTPEGIAKGHVKNHVGWQEGGKRRDGESKRGNITYDGPDHPSRPSVKDKINNCFSK